MLARRTYFTVLIGLALTPLAGLIGLLMTPLLIPWLFAAGVSLYLTSAKLVIVSASMPLLVGAMYAWPLTCLVLPLAAARLCPTTASTIFVYALVGLLIGPLSFLATSLMSDPTMNLASRIALATTSGFSGAFLGLIYGYIVWRYDRSSEALTAPLAGKDFHLSVVVSAIFLLIAVTYLVLTPPTYPATEPDDKCAVAKINRDDPILIRFICSHQKASRHGQP